MFWTRRTGRVETFCAPVVLLATGGCGKVYLYTTNPDIATGDGVAMAYRAGAAVANMEFIQFHPDLPLSSRGANLSHQRSRARRRRRAQNHAMAPEFMDKYHPLKSLAPRDVVARAIDSEMKRTGADYVLLDITHKPADFIQRPFSQHLQDLPAIRHRHHARADSRGAGGALSMRRRADQCGWRNGHRRDFTRSAKWPAPDLHGANRLASNSLLEALVCAHRAAQRVLAAAAAPSEISQFPAGNPATPPIPDEQVVISHNWDEIRRLMWDYVGIVRTNKRLQRARSRIANLQEEIQQYYWDFIVTSDLLELRNIATRRGIDRHRRLATARKPRPELQSGLSRCRSGMGATRHGFNA